MNNAWKKETKKTKEKARKKVRRKECTKGGKNEDIKRGK